MQMLWIDMETTGLNPRYDIPLEIGLAVSDEHGDVQLRGSWLIWQFIWRDLYAKARAHPVVGPMHEKSGLWDDLAGRRGEALTRAEADITICDWLESWDVPKGLPMCGSSIGSLDRPFVQKHFPLLHQYFHYRNVDVSSVKELCRIYAPAVFEAKPQVESGHRVLGDIDDSITELRYYLDTGFLGAAG